MLNRLFVYGTLKPGGPNEHILDAFDGTWESASVTGILKNKGWGAALGFPGIVLDKKGNEIEGYIFTPRSLSLFWVTLDEFEGEAYRRTLTKVKLKNGNFVDAYIYTLRED